MKRAGKLTRFFTRALPWTLAGIASAALLALLFGLILMFLWNWLMPEIFNLGEINFWQAWGLEMLAFLLFKGPGKPGMPGKPRFHPADKAEWKRRFEAHARMKGHFRDHSFRGFDPDFYREGWNPSGETKESGEEEDKEQAPGDGFQAPPRD